MIFALRHISSEFPPCDDLFEEEGFSLDLPEKLSDAIKSAIAFAKSDEDELATTVQITIGPNGILCRSSNDKGWIESPIDEPIDIKEPITFGANPQFLLQVLGDSDSAFVTTNRIVFNTPNYQQVLALMRPQE